MLRNKQIEEDMTARHEFNQMFSFEKIELPEDYKFRLYP